MIFSFNGATGEISTNVKHSSKKETRKMNLKCIRKNSNKQKSKYSVGLSTTQFESSNTSL